MSKSNLNPTTHRLDGKKNDVVWSPNVHYKSSLTDINNQLIPSEIFRLNIQTTKKIARRLQHLEFQIQLNYDKCIRAITKIQAVYRGSKVRLQINKIKQSLAIARDKRVANSRANEFIEANDLYSAYSVLASLNNSSISVLLVQTKLLYSLKEFEKCIEVAESILGTKVFFVVVY